MLGNKEYRGVTRAGDALAGESRYVSGSYEGTWCSFSARWDLLKIDAALCDPIAFNRIWAIQDGYGERGFTPPQGYDWSGIRDSSDEARAAMYAVASEFISDAEMEAGLGLAAVPS